MKKICALKGCYEEAHDRSESGYCGGHEFRFKNYGSPYLTEGGMRYRGMSREITAGYIPLNTVEVPSFLSKPCLVWKGARDYRERVDGTKVVQHGLVGIGGKVYYCHRVVWEDANGPIPDGLEINHECNTYGCCEIEHMSAKTHKENMDYMLECGRFVNRWGPQRFDKAGYREFIDFCDENQGLTQKEIGNHFGVSESLVSRILGGHYYRWAK